MYFNTNTVTYAIGNISKFLHLCSLFHTQRERHRQRDRQTEEKERDRWKRKRERERQSDTDRHTEKDRHRERPCVYVRLKELKISWWLNN